MTNTTITVEKVKLIESLSTVLFSANKTDHSIIRCVNFQATNNNLKLATTDKHRLTVHNLHVLNSNQDVNRTGNIYANNIKTLLSNLKKTSKKDKEVKISIDEQYSWLFQCLDLEEELPIAYSKDAYPKYEQLIPNRFTNIFTVDNRELLSKILLLKDNCTYSNLITFPNDYLFFKYERDELYFWLEKDNNKNNISKISVVSHNQTSEEICFNPLYFIEYLRKINKLCSSIQFSYNLFNQPALFNFPDNLENLHMLMPLQIAPKCLRR